MKINMEAVEQIKTRVVGVDIREVKTTYAVVDIRGEIIAMDYFMTMDYPDVSDYVSALSEKIIMLVEENGGYEMIRSVGMSAPSANFMTGCIENAANMPWKGVVPLAAMLRDRLGLAVALANDAHVTALGEKAFGSAHGLKDFVVVSISHGGLGSCIFMDGKPHLGVNGFAGEVGHSCVEVGGRECGCGRRGCLETYCSDKGLVRTVEELLQAEELPSAKVTVTAFPSTVQELMSMVSSSKLKLPVPPSLRVRTELPSCSETPLTWPPKPMANIE